MPELATIARNNHMHIKFEMMCMVIVWLSTCVGHTFASHAEGNAVSELSTPALNNHLYIKLEAIGTVSVWLNMRVCHLFAFDVNAVSELSTKHTATTFISNSKLLAR